MEPVRIDQYLMAARIYKSRTVAREACDAGHVKLEGVTVKPSHLVVVGNEIRCTAPRGVVVIKVLATAAKRLSPQLARALYEDHSPPPPPREERMPQRDRGAGRPTKADRRAMARLFGGDDVE
ncbi:MAG TPA: RNA-binding S4 domain-containing protein [Polyangiaceae bacterium]|nr:RNA-binding S4 domain-containing protein [Polyangiaceae bacterium]